MPRLLPSLLRYAHSIDPLLPILLPACRDLHSSRNELRWLREHAKIAAGATTTTNTTKLLQWQHRFRKLVVERATGRPIQYILGNQPFGDLEVLCEPGVLIPRPETESLTTHLAALLSLSTYLQEEKGQQSLRILDLCTGTGCISLLLHSLLSHHFPHLFILGIDNSPAAIALAAKNKKHNLRLDHLRRRAVEQVHFQLGDLFAPNSPNPTLALQQSWLDKKWDILVSNPPYISPRSFDNTTAKSVRDWEPKSALVPPGVISKTTGDLGDASIGDAFYPRLLDIAKRVSAKVVLFEVADLAQATRVAGMVLKGKEWDRCEIWRDWPGQGGTEGWGKVQVGGRGVNVVGEGNGRALLAWKVQSGRLIGKGMIRKSN